jgi:hypothetical protein
MPENKLTPAKGAGQATSGMRTPGNRNNLVDRPNAELPIVAHWMLKRPHEGYSPGRTLHASRSYAFVFFL